MLYEDQAHDFDERAAVPDGAGAAIAEALVDLVALKPGQAWLEVGVGTGALSMHLVRLPIRYVGFDQSPAMVKVFRERLARSGRSAELYVADGNTRWPVANGSIDVIFSARALHHIDADHVVREVQRVAGADGLWLVLGQVRRAKDSVRSLLRQQMRQLLYERGFAGRSHTRHARTVFDALEAQGGRCIPPRVAARWTNTHRPIDALTAWTSKAGLAGLDLPDDVKAGVLADLRAWAAHEYGDLEKEHVQEEVFELNAIFLRGRLDGESGSHQLSALF